MKIIVLPGDGIGPETVSVATATLRAVDAKFGLGLDLQHDVAGHDSLKQYGTTVRRAARSTRRSTSGKTSTCLPTFARPAPTRAAAHGMACLIWWSYAKTPRGSTPTAISNPVAAKC